MKYVEVLPLSRTGAGDQIFTYHISDDILVGSLVSIPLKNRVIRGLVVKFTKKPNFITKEVEKILAFEPILTEVQLKLAEKIADYYFCSISDVISAMLPFDFGKKRQTRDERPETRDQEKPHKLTADQQKIYKEIKDGLNPSKFLLFGVTGSGKTEIYLQLVAGALKEGKGSIILVPEISLTPQALERFTMRFGDEVAVWHSNLLETEKYDTWQKIKSGQKKVVLGTRSAIFAPISNLAYVFIDEEHETSYKQDQTPRYEAGRVAEWLCEITNTKLISGSATPRVETYKKALDGEYKLFTLNKRIVQDSMPPVKIVDMRDEFKKGNKTIFSDDLREAIEKALSEKKQVMLFVNRRGASTFVVCRDCGYVASCPNCEIPLTFHPLDQKKGFKTPQSPSLTCHHCGYETQVPAICPNCKSTAIKFFGLGTQRAEIEAKRLFPVAKIARMDRDTTKKRGSHGEIYEGFLKKDFDILIGTQLIAKGWDLPNVAVVGVISADTQLHLPDFRSAEHTFALLTQVAGRTGRGYHPGEVLIQTYNPESYSIKFAAKHDFPGFYEREIIERKKYNYPPFSTLIKMTFSSKIAEKTRKEAEEMAQGLKNSLIRPPEPVSESQSQEIPDQARNDKNDVQFFGPSPSFLPKLAGKYRYQIVIKVIRDQRPETRGKNTETKNQNLESVLSTIKKDYKAGWIVDVNPENLL